MNNKICPFYFYFDKLINFVPSIVICTYKDFFDLKSRIQIYKVIAEGNEYRLIFDECSDINNILANMYSLTINDNLLSNASSQLFILKEKFESRNFSDSYSIIDPNFKNLKFPENEFLSFNGLTSIGII